MIIEKIVPIDSDMYNKWRHFFSLVGDRMDLEGWMQLFAIWTLTVSGIVISMDIQDRYVYWNWDGWLIGFVKLILVSIIFFTYLRPKNFWMVGNVRLTIKDIVLHCIIGFMLMFFGWLEFELISGNISEKLEPFVLHFYLFYSFISLLPYLFVFVSCLLVFQFVIELDRKNGTWNNFHWNNKVEYFSISVIMMLIALLIGIKLEDPILSTAGAVAIPFSAIALAWPNHVRHLQRARFYPLFIFSMFLCVRAPWFIIPLSILFFVVRTVNYFRYGIVHPSFGVDFLEDN
ncbi:MAG: hypothetical protein ACJZ12_00580 [Candidatus Neomarinimicrobiota bacterium]